MLPPFVRPGPEAPPAVLVALARAPVDDAVVFLPVLLVEPLLVFEDALELGVVLTLLLEVPGDLAPESAAADPLLLPAALLVAPLAAVVALVPPLSTLLSEPPAEVDRAPAVPPDLSELCAAPGLFRSDPSRPEAVPLDLLESPLAGVGPALFFALPEVLDAALLPPFDAALLSAAALSLAPVLPPERPALPESAADAGLPEPAPLVCAVFEAEASDGLVPLDLLGSSALAEDLARSVLFLSRLSWLIT
ncbi:MAG: hypothetical protein WBL23_11050 [Salinisphaera sp.]|uniref:hypothetical protein n=1 Tax=Salinisphaera sp. TaxID=1914330 RepID=UPI003C79B672